MTHPDIILQKTSLVSVVIGNYCYCYYYCYHQQRLQPNNTIYSSRVLWLIKCQALSLPEVTQIVADLDLTQACLT